MKEFQPGVGRKFRLRRIDPSDTSAFGGKKEDAEVELEQLRSELDRLQELLFADHRYAILVVLQGMDTAGKDATIRHVFAGVNPQGVQVASFKVPTPEESGHDFLWRIHPRVPEKGQMAIFNRSHYEDVLAVRVHRLVPRDVWERRYRAINEFERELSNEGTTLLKFFLHIDAKEQKKRLEARLDDPTKRWKFSPRDLQERKLWSAYMEAYEEMIRETDTDWAPWYVIPANHPWFRNWAVSKTLTGALKALKLRYPKVSPHATERRIN
jgi:PPK2 family polyphosphate:nucleotide phosphotransferase